MTVEKLLIELELKTKAFKQQAEDVKATIRGSAQEATKATGTVQKATQRIRSLVSNAAGGIATETKRVQDSVRNAVNGSNREYNRLQTQINRTTRTLQDLEAKQAALGDRANVPTDEYAKLQAKLQELQKEYDKLSDKGDEWLKVGADPRSGGFEYLDRQLKKINDQMLPIEEEMKRLEASGGAFRPSDKFSELEDKIKAAREELKKYNAEAERIKPGGSESPPTPKAASFGEQLKYVSKATKTMGAEFRNATKIFPKFGHALTKAGHDARMTFGRILRYALGLRGIYTLFSRLRSAIKEGFSNLSQFSNRTAKDLAILKGSLTQIKNALATAFAPIVTAVAPYIQAFANYITTACNALAQFFAALTGQKTVTLATTGLGDIAAGATNAADATNAANNAAKEYQNTLMGFDQINKLDDQSAGSAGAAGGVAGTSGFATSEVENVYSGWAEKIKEAWKNADFYEIGRSAGEKLRDGLNAINWDKVKETGEKVAKSIATGLNGFLETPGLFTAVGTTLAEALNTVFGTANTFAEVFNWKALGKAVSDTINAFFNTFDFKLAAEAISNWTEGFLDSAIEAVAGVDWENVGEQIATFISNIEFKDITIKIAKLTLEIGQAVGELAKGLADGFFEAEMSLFFKAGDSRTEAWVKLLEWLQKLILAPDITAKLQVLMEGPGVSFADLFTNKEPLSKDAKINLKEGQLDKGLKKGGDMRKTYDLYEKKTAKIGLARGEIAKTLKKKGDTRSLYDRYANKVAKIGLGNGGVDKGLKSGGSTRTTYDKFANKTATITVKSTIDSNTQTLKSLVDAKTKKNFNFTATGGKIVMTPEYMAEGGMFVNGRWKPITMAANGGSFDMGQVFVARERGPELVGQMGSHTAVMNNNQIVSSVSDGVFKAVVAAMGNRGDSHPIITLEGDAKKLFRVVQTEAKNYTNSTGLPAFA